MAAGKVRDPDRNIPRSTVFGTLATAVVYMLSLTAVFGILPDAAGVDATGAVLRRRQCHLRRHWAGNVMAARRDHLGHRCAERLDDDLRRDAAGRRQGRPVPRTLRRLSRQGVPAFGIIASTALASIAMAINYIGSSGATVFTTLVLMTGITAAIPYGFSALAQIKWRVADRAQLQTPRFVRDMVVAVLSLIFSVLFIWYSRNTGHDFWSTGLRSSWRAPRCCSASPCTGPSDRT